MASGKKTRGLGSSAESGVALDETLVGDSSNASSLDGPTLDSDGASWARRLPSDLADLKPGAALAHFFVLGELGVGGMGVVLAAYDPDLDRKVAIKVLRAARGSSGSESSANARLLREAQALAKLSHPNVVTIFEVASTGDRVAVVMEYIDGLTLTQWLASTERNWREVIEVFCQAGRGLAAAHAAGLVHRDFKPDNVLVGKGGRVRVTDFGLVSTASEQTESSESSEPEPESDPDVDPRAVPSTARLSATLTCEGALLGTPAYMAPEQLDRTRADANADQFSFCVALYEGLYGSRPFSGQTYEELRDAVHAGRVNDAPAHSHVPGWVRELVVRGLRADPTERHPTMESLLAALERDRGQRRARLQWGAAVVGIVAIASVTVVGLTRGGDSPQATLCTSAEDKLTGVWDADVRDRMSASFVATDRPHAAETLALVDAEIERRTEAWLVTRSDACEATHVRGEQSEQLLDLRMHCLDRRLGEIRAMTALFAGASDSTLVDGAMKALSQMTPLAVCSDTQWLLAETPLPEDPAARKRVAEMRLRLDEITALERAGRYQNGIELAKAVAQEVVAVDYPPLRAEALHQLAELLARGGDPKEAEDALYRGLQAAADARDHELVAEAWIELILLIGSREGQHERALALRQPAEASVAQAGNHDAQVAQLASSLGLVLAHMGDYAAAHEHHARALEIQERIFGPDHSRSSLTRGNLANALAEQGMYPEARGHYERALASQDQVLGPHHPEIAFTLNNLGNVVGYQGDHEAAVPFFERALAIWQEALAPNHPLVGTCLNNLGNAHSDLGHPDEARTYYQRALDMFIAKFGSEHPATAAVTGNLGELEANQENYTRALELCGRSLTIYENTLGAEHPDTAYALTCIGRAHLGTNAARSALKPLRRALAARESNPGDPADLAETRFALARALWATREDRPSAIALAEQSRDAYAAAGDHKRREHDDVLGALQRWSSD